MPLATVPPALLLATSSANQLMRSLFDDTFAGVHHLAAFDWALLIPYFVDSDRAFVLRVPPLRDDPEVSEARKTDAAWNRPCSLPHLPRVTIQLPLYNERYVVERLMEEVARWIIRGTCCRSRCWTIRPTIRILSPKRWCDEYRAAGLPIEYHHRTNRDGFKAGALQEGLKTATASSWPSSTPTFVPPARFSAAHRSTTSPIRRWAWCKRAGAI